VAQTPFFNGKNVTLIFLRDSKTIHFLAKSMSVKENATLAADDVNGEDRSRFQKIVNGYDIKIDCYMEDVEQLKTLLEETAQLDTRTQPVDKGVGFLVKPNNATRAAFEATGISIDDWEWNLAGRTDRSMLTVPVRAQRFDQVPAV